MLVAQQVGEKVLGGADLPLVDSFLACYRAFVPDKNIFARYREIVGDWQAFNAAISRPLPTTIWANPLRVSPSQLREFVPGLEPLTWESGGFRTPPELSPGHHWAYLAGLYHIQEEVSMIPVHFLDIQAGQRVLDLCAAPGNKSAQIGTMLRNGGAVVSNDRSMMRTRASRHTLERLGLLNVTTTICDAIEYPTPNQLFDRVLVDAPCTGEGTCRKLKPSRWRVSAEVSRRLAVQQLKILRNAIGLCRPGGRIVYSTCTFAPEENEAVVDAVLRDSTLGVRLRPARLAGFAASPGLTSWQGRALHPDLHHALRVWPHQNDSGGFFIAVLERSEDEATVSAGQADEAAVAPFGMEESSPWLEQLSDRFGIEPEHFADRLIFRVGDSHLYVTNREQQRVRGLTPDAVGMRFMHTTARYPKLTTSAAMHFGSAATTNTVELSADQARAYFARVDLCLSPAQAQGCTGMGYVLLRYQGFTLGAGVFHCRSNQVESLYPKGWKRNALMSP